MSPFNEGDHDFLAGDRWQFERQGCTFRHGGLTLLCRCIRPASLTESMMPIQRRRSSCVAAGTLLFVEPAIPAAAR